MTNALIDAVLLIIVGFFLGCDVGNGCGWSRMIVAQAGIAVVLGGLLLGDLGLVHGL